MRLSPNRIWFAIAVVAVLLVPTAAIGAGTFDDVPAGHTFEADIDWLASAGVTKGCNPPGNTEFCPDDLVTRGQMAAFLHRLADGVVDADTVDGVDAADLVSVHGATGLEMDDFFAAGFVSILSDTVEAPSAGFFHITAVTYAGDDATMAGTGALVLKVDVDGDPFTPETLVWFSECVGDNCGDDVTNMTGVVAVSAGAHTIDIMALENGFGSHIHGTSISTLFTPFGS